MDKIELIDEVYKDCQCLDAKISDYAGSHVLMDACLEEAERITAKRKDLDGCGLRKQERRALIAIDDLINRHKTILLPYRVNREADLETLEKYTAGIAESLDNANASIIRSIDPEEDCMDAVEMAFNLDFLLDIKMALLIHNIVQVKNSRLTELQAIQRVKSMRSRLDEGLAKLNYAVCEYNMILDEIVDAAMMTPEVQNLLDNAKRAIQVKLQQQLSKFDDLYFNYDEDENEEI